MNLRPYQQECVAAVAKGFVEYDRQLVVLPTGGGKTIVFAKQAERFWLKRGERTLVLAHREELIEQAADKIYKATGLEASIEKAARKGAKEAPVVVASIQSLQGGRLEGWSPDHFGLIVVDEAHHVLADQYQNILSHFTAKVLGVTATPDRGDKKSLAEFFQNVAYECTILDLIRDGYLSPVMVKAIPIKIDISTVRTVAGDLDAGQLGNALEPYLDVIAEHLAALKGRKILAFLPLIATSIKFVQACEKAGLTAKHVDGETDDRKAILSEFGAGEFVLLSNAAVLVEGYDEPTVDCVVILRPTKSRPWFAQAVGRITRPMWPSDYGWHLWPAGVSYNLETVEGRKQCIADSPKPTAYLLDFLWLHAKHNLARPASLVAKSPKEEESITDVLLSDEQKDLGEAVAAAESEREAALLRELAENINRKSRYISLEDVAGLLKDTKLREYAPTMKWEEGKASPKQEAVLSRFGIRAKSKGEAMLLMNTLFQRSRDKLASPGQLKVLHQLKHPEPETMSAKDAKAWITAKFDSRRR